MIQNNIYSCNYTHFLISSPLTSSNTCLDWSSPVSQMITKTNYIDSPYNVYEYRYIRVYALIHVFKREKDPYSG